MNLQQQLKLWLFLASASTSLAYTNNAATTHPLDLTVSLDPSIINNDIDISDVLLEAEAALKAAQGTLQSSSIGKEIMNLSQMQIDMENIFKMDSTTSSSPSSQDQMITTAVVGSALGVVVGSPLVLGAALGIAGSHLMEGENAEQTRKLLENAGKGIATQLQGAIEFAQQQIEAEEDPSKIHEKMLLAFEAKLNNDLAEVKTAPTQLINAFKGALESEDLKAAPGRAFNAFRGFLGSAEVKQAQSRAFKAFQDSLESDEVKGLQKRAAQALKETLK
jgi:hypothetical protein